MVAGPNGSGKSTLTKVLLDLESYVGCYLNADTIAQGMPGTPLEASRLAQLRVREERTKALRNSEDHCWETVMSHRSHIDHLELCKLAGFETRTIYVATDDPRVNLARVRERVQDGGHDVPPDKTVERYYKSIANLPAALVASDRARIFDNSLPTRPFRNVARWNGSRLQIEMPYLEILRWFIGVLSALQILGVTIDEARS